MVEQWGSEKKIPIHRGKKKKQEKRVYPEKEMKKKHDLFSYPRLCKEAACCFCFIKPLFAIFGVLFLYRLMFFGLQITVPNSD